MVAYWIILIAIKFEEISSQKYAPENYLELFKSIKSILDS